MNSFTLNNGVVIPAVGFGTGIAKEWTRNPFIVAKKLLKEQIKNIIEPGFKENNKYPVLKDVKKEHSLMGCVSKASVLGCRLFDTARAYDCSESYLADALWGGDQDKRKEYFIVTKATNISQRDNKVRECFEESLKNLKTDYVDLYLLHWPQTGTWLEAWKELEKIYFEGKARAIGVCNCKVHHLEELKQIAEVQPMVNEVECHPLLPQNEVRQYCKENDIQLIAHTPTGKMNKLITENQGMRDICRVHQVEPSQVILRWHYQLGDVSIPNTTSIEHLAKNLDIWDFNLSDSEMTIIANMENGTRIWPDPDNCDFSKL